MVGDLVGRLPLAAEVAPGVRIVTIRLDLQDAVPGVIDSYLKAAVGEADPAVCVDRLIHGSASLGLAPRQQSTSDRFSCQYPPDDFGMEGSAGSRICGYGRLSRSPRTAAVCCSRVWVVSTKTREQQTAAVRG